MKAVNLILHILNCCLLLKFIEAILNEKKLAFLSVLLFTCHPIHTEAISGIVSRSDLAACGIFLLCGIFHFFVFHKGKL